MTEFSFEKFPRIKRLNRDCVITEKIDGTNAQINFDIHGNILCGSRNRSITPSDDNFGFATWAHNNKIKLFSILGVGRHYGEWWGQGINRGYNLKHNKFSLFNTGRWSKDKSRDLPQLSVVPILYTGLFNTSSINTTMELLHYFGSMASPGYKKPEGIVIFHTASSTLFKMTFDHDITGKPVDK